MMNILITDDHPVVLAGIRQIVETALPESRIRQAATADEALAIIEAGMVDILIADLELNGESGIRLIHRVHDIQPNVKVLVYTMHEEVWVVRQLLEADPDGIVLKADDTEELERAFAALCNGKGYYSVAFNRLLNSIAASPAMLSKREAEILKLTAKGYSSTDIAQRLTISVNTVEFHRRRIMQKLNAANAAEAVGKAAELGLFFD